MELKPEDIKKEYLLPVLIDELIQNGRGTVLMYWRRKDTWFGVTYQEDKETAVSMQVFQLSWWIEGSLPVKILYTDLSTVTRAAKIVKYRDG